MATASAAVKQMDDITECPICTEVYTDPRVLPCIHTYCLKCIETWSKDKHPGDEVACPLCRKEFTLPPNGARDLPKNFFVGKLLQVRELLQTGPRSTPCDACSSDDSEITNSATMYCLECQEKLCEDCVAAHRKVRATRSHKLMTLGEEAKPEELYAKLQAAVCDKHREKSLEIYCFDCKLVVCMICYVEDHNSHTCSGVSKVSEDFCKQMKNDVDKMASAMKKCQEMLEKVSKDKRAFTGQITKVESEISEKADELKRLIEGHKQKLLEELTAIKQKKCKEIDTLSEEIERHLQTMESLKTYTDEVISKGTDCDIARAADGLHDRADEILNLDIIQRSLADLRHITVKLTSSSSVADTSRTLGKLVVTDDDKGEKPSAPLATTQQGLRQESVDAEWQKLRQEEQLLQQQLRLAQHHQQLTQQQMQMMQEMGLELPPVNQQHQQKQQQKLQQLLQQLNRVQEQMQQLHKQ